MTYRDENLSQEAYGRVLRSKIEKLENKKGRLKLSIKLFRVKYYLFIFIMLAIGILSYMATYKFHKKFFSKPVVVTKATVEILKPKQKPIKLEINPDAVKSLVVNKRYTPSPNITEVKFKHFVTYYYNEFNETSVTEHAIKSLKWLDKMRACITAIDKLDFLHSSGHMMNADTKKSVFVILYTTVVYIDDPKPDTSCKN